MWAAGGTLPAIVKKKNLTKTRIQWSCLVGTFGSSYVDADPEQQEENPKAHEERGHQEDEELIVDVLTVLGVGDLINEEPGCEEHASGQQHHCQMMGRQPGSLG